MPNHSIRIRDYLRSMSVCLSPVKHEFFEYSMLDLRSKIHREYEIVLLQDYTYLWLVGFVR